MNKWEHLSPNSYYSKSEFNQRFTEVHKASAKRLLEKDHLIVYGISYHGCSHVLKRVGDLELFDMFAINRVEKKHTTDDLPFNKTSKALKDGPSDDQPLVIQDQRTRVVVEVMGGMVINVYSSVDGDAVIIDWQDGEKNRDDLNKLKDGVTKSLKEKKLFKIL